MKKILGIGLLLSLPVVIMFIAVLSLVFFMIFASGGGVQGEVETVETTSTETNYMAYCSVDDGELNKSRWNSFFDESKNVGILGDQGDFIIEYSEEKGVDPVLVMAIITHETAYGSSDALIYKNNPGGIMDANNDWKTLVNFRSLEGGLKYTINNIARLILEEGLVKIEDLGNVYAPIGAENDPTGLNKNWVPTVTEITTKLGGLTKNCRKLGELEFLDDMAWVVPATKRITSGFGKRNCEGCSSNHKGLDISIGAGQSYGLEVVALSDGVVSSSLNGCTENQDCSSTWGNHVMIEHDDNLFTVYAHFQETLVETGQKVEAGDIIGLIGNTGSSEGAHLHFETHMNGKPVDPYTLLKSFFED